MKRKQDEHPAKVTGWHVEPGNAYTVAVLTRKDYAQVYADPTPRTYLEAIAEADRLKATYPNALAYHFCWTEIAQ
jgi:hypothetical protein